MELEMVQKGVNFIYQSKTFKKRSSFIKENKNIEKIYSKYFLERVL